MSLICVREVKQSRERNLGVCSLVSERRSVDWVLNHSKWDAWLVHENTQRIRCELASYESIGSGIDAFGNHATFVDNELFIGSDDNEIRKATSNEIELLLPNNIALQAPFFLSSTPETRCWTMNGTASIEVGCLGQVPDFQAYAAFCNHFGRSFSNSKRGDSLTKVALDILIEANTWFSVSLHAEHVSLPATLFIRKNIDKGAYEADIMCVGASNCFNNVTTPLEMRRSVHWVEEGENCIATSRIGWFKAAIDVK